MTGTPNPRNTNGLYDIAAVKAAAQGRWLEILTEAGIDGALLDGRGHPCPKCGGHDRFSAFKDVAERGAVICRHCFAHKNGDGLSTLQWWQDCNLPEAIKFVAEYLGLGVPRASAVDTTTRNTGGKRVVSTSTPANSRKYTTAKEAVRALEESRGPRSADWTYHDENGQPCGVVVRWDGQDGKEFLPISRNGDGWVIGAMPEPRPLYGLSSLGTTQRVYVAEGEKCVDLLRSIGLVAVTSSGGSGAARKTDWMPLGGREVVIWPDLDEPGRKYAKDVAEILVGLGCKVRILDPRDLPAGEQLQEGDDIADWLNSHHELPKDAAREHIERLAETTPVWRPDRAGPPIEPFRPFPTDALPEPLRQFVEDGAKAIGCDTTYLALPILAVAASAIGNSRRLRIKNAWLVPPILWMLIVGESGTQKSPGFRLAMRTIEDLIREAHQRNEQSERQYESELRRYERDLAAWKRRRNSQEPPPEKPAPPRRERYVVSDTTIEALALILSQNPRGLLLARDELAGWLNSFDRYAGGKGSDAAHWLTMYNAGQMIVDRKTGHPRTIMVDRAAVCITGSIQPGPLRRALGREHMEDGICARLLMAYPPRRPKRWSEEEISPQIMQATSRLMDRLYALNLPDEGPLIVGMTAEARRLWIDFYERHATESADFVGELAAAMSKLEEIPLRLALIIHCVRGIDGDVDEESMAAGIRITEWFKYETRRVYAMLCGSEEDEERHRLVELIERKGGSVTPRDLMRSSRKWKSAAEAEAALDDLVKVGYGHWINQPSPSVKGGRPTRVFKLYDPVDIDTTQENPGLQRGCVNADTTDSPDPLRGGGSVNGEATTPETPSDDDWGEV